MINDIIDLKNRTLVESNILKSFILNSGKNFHDPNRDDILIHDYQIASSVTLNSILSNYIVNLKKSWDLIRNQSDENSQTYFQIVDSTNAQYSLHDQTKLVLDINNGNGTFKERNLNYKVQKIELKDNTHQFVNLDTIWYGIVRNVDEIQSVYYDSIELVDSMNNYLINPNIFGDNPFDRFMTIGVEDAPNYR